MEQTMKEFLDYLCYIGIVSDDSISIFLSSINSNVNSSVKVKEILMNSFYFYIMSLSEKNKKKISVNIVTNFFINKLKVNIKILQNLIKKYEKSYFEKVKISFFHWYKQTFSNNINKEYYHNNKSRNESSVRNYDDWIDESTINNNVSEKKPIKNTKYTRNLFCSNNYKNNNYFSKTLRSRSNNSSRTILQDFISRQDQYNKLQKKNKELLIQQNEDEYDLLCTFIPKIKGKSFERNSSLKNSLNHSKNIYQKLYEDSNRRQKVQSQKLLDYVKHFRSDSSLNSNKRSSKKIFDKNKIEKLYNDYKQKKFKRRELTEKINKEEGITFKPYIKSYKNHLSKL